MDSASQVTENQQQPVVFRGKKRKTYRQRTGAEADGSAAPVDAVPDALPHAPTPKASTPDLVAPAAKKDHDSDGENDDDDGDESSAISEALRLRNARKSRLRGGVAFGVDNNNTHSGGGEDDDELSLMIREEEKKAVEQSIVAAATKRFAPQTGLSGEIVNKHMEEYIEAELAKRHSMVYGGLQQAHQSSSSSQSGRGGKGKGPKETAAAGDKSADKHTALTGKLFEVDLGDEIRNRNALMTDRAMRKLQGLVVEDEEQSERPKKVRLGRDGKPWRPKNQRDNDAIKRDQIVEEILRENKLDVYETPKPQPGPSGGDDNEGAADDRIAEEFRREFLDALAERQRRRRPAAPPSKAAGKKEEEGLRGPKLGGSRNTRAAYRDLLLQKEREGKK